VEVDISDTQNGCKYNDGMCELLSAAKALMDFHTRLVAVHDNGCACLFCELGKAIKQVEWVNQQAKERLSLPQG
jgi:hypothetical protein